MERTAGRTRWTVRGGFTALALIAVHGVGRAQASAASIGPNERYARVASALERFIEREMRDKHLPALSISLVDDQAVVWARGFGYQNPKDSTPATAETVYRVGSVSKLFTDIGVMQLVEQGKVDLDVPVSRYIPEFAPQNPFGGAITLRHLMSHRAGLVREPPEGSYFDSTGASLEETVKSLNAVRLAYAPGARTKYSNAAIAVVGYVLERIQGTPFAPYLKRTVLDPMGLGRSAFEPEPALVQDLAKAVMWTYDGRVFDAPTFQLGMAPAGSMYSTVTDLGRFMSVLFAGGRGAGGQVLGARTLEAMWTPQFAAPGAKTGFGIGFALGEVDGRRSVRHGGAIYGFATELAALPDDKLGVAVATTKDVANMVTSRVATAALRMMLAAKAGRALQEPGATRAVPLALARRVHGVYGRGAKQVELVARDSTVYATLAVGGERLTLRLAGGDTLVADDEQSYGIRVGLDGNKLIFGEDTLARVEPLKPPPIPPSWRGLIGEYGWNYNTLFILEKNGRLHALIEWFYEYPLTEISPSVFAFPKAGLYDGERLIFTRGPDGRATRVEAANVVFPRRELQGEDGSTFRITPLRPVDELRTAALAAKPPVESGPFARSELVELTTLDPTIKLDIRYATTNNFLSSRVYEQPRAFLQRPAALALVRAHRALRAKGYGLLIHDAYRPWYVTKMFYDGTPDDKKIFVANPAQGSRHNRGAAVDLTLFELRTGRPVEMPGGYDEFSERSYPDYPGGTSLQRWHRELLREAMEAEGFRVYAVEWWHFDYSGWRSFPIGNVRFEEMAR